MINALSFDVEEYFHVHGFRDVIRPQDWDSLDSRIVPSTRHVLQLLRKYNTHATFFILGWVAERYPELLREIADGGHEIASHGYLHEPVYELDELRFQEDLERATAAITSAYPDSELLGYRAPSFSIDDRTPWAFPVLDRLGFQYDSSVSPASLHDRYGVHDAPRFVYKTACGLTEIPPTTVRLVGQNLPAVGGGHFRLVPLAVSRWAIRRVNREGHPAVTYLHPWEFDSDQPRIWQASRSSRFRHYVNIEKTERRLESLLREYEFDRMDRVFQTWWAKRPTAVVGV